jgi:hypothetical protein
MYLITNLKLKKKYGIEDGKERETLYEAVDEWVGECDCCHCFGCILGFFLAS